MSTLPFWTDPVFWSALALLSVYSGAGFIAAWRDGKATPTQFCQGTKGYIKTPWICHAGFWTLIVVLSPVYAWTTATMWPSWRLHPEVLVVCVLLGGVIGAIMQCGWSRAEWSADAWSDNGRPNGAGQIHILQMSPEIGIMLMTLPSTFWFGEMPKTMFLGLLCITLAHFSMGSHWLLRGAAPSWRNNNDPISKAGVFTYAVALSLLLLAGFTLLTA